MRIAYLGPSPSDTGGLARMAAIVLRELAREGNEVDAYATAWDGSLDDVTGVRPVLEPVEYDRLSALLSPAPLLKFVWGQGRRACAQRRLAHRLVEEHRRHPYDVVYQFSQPELLGLRSRRAKLPPIVVHPEVHAAGELRSHVREDELARQCESRARIAAVRVMLAIRSLAQRRDLRTVAAVIAPSRRFGDLLVADYGLDPARVHVVPNPVDLEHFRKSSTATRPREIVFVSRLSVRKGLELVVELSRRLDDLAGELRIVVVGDVTMWSDYRALLASLNSRVAEYRGFVQPQDLPAFLGGASMLVQPSHYEPFALTVAEALACGTPVVASDEVGAGEWLSGAYVELFRAGDADAFERAVRTMLFRLDHMENAVREAARSAAESSFAPAPIVRQVADVLRARSARGRRLLVVSHPSVIDVNQTVYLELAERGWDVRLVAPSSWPHDFAGGRARPMPLCGLEAAFTPLPVMLAGKPQRHVYLARAGKIVADFAPDVVFLEQEPFSMSAVQWGIASARAGVPFGVQAEENLDRAFPWIARVNRRWVLKHAAFVAARSPRAGELARRWGAVGRLDVAPHAVPAWPARNGHRSRGEMFTVGFAGRLIPEKGIGDLLAALHLLEPPVRLLVAGRGPLEDEVVAAGSADIEVELRRGISHDRMDTVLREMDVLVLPSRSTPRWAEQFGRVLVEAMSQRTPVIGSDCGEIPWVIESAGGGIVYPEGDVAQLAKAIARLRHSPELREELGARGSEGVDRLFSVSTAADALEKLLLGTRS